MLLGFKINLLCKSDHVTPLLIQLHWLPIKQRIEFKMLYNGNTFHYLEELLVQHIPDNAP